MPLPVSSRACGRLPSALVGRVLARSLSANEPFGRKNPLDFIDPASIEDHLAMRDLPHPGAALEAIGVSSGENQIGRAAILLLAAMDTEKVALAVRDVAVDFDQFVGDVVAGPVIPDQRIERPWNEIGGSAFEHSVIVGRVGMIDAMEQFRVAAVDTPAIAHQDFVDLLLVQEHAQGAFGFFVDAHVSISTPRNCLESRDRVRQRRIARHYRARQGEAMHFRRTVIDSKRADVAVDAFDHRVGGDAEAAENLQRTIDHPPERFRAEHLAQAGLVARALAAIEQPGRLPDREAAQMQVGRVVGKLKPHALMLADKLAECVTAPRVVSRDRVAAPGRAEPSHAMRQPRRAETHLGVAKAVTDLSQNPLGADAHVVKLHFRMAAGRVVVERFELAHDPESGRVHVNQKHGRSAVGSVLVERARHHDIDARAGSAGDQPLAPRDDKFVAVAARRGLHQIGVRARAVVGLGHREDRANLARDQRPQPSFLLLVVRNLVEQIGVAFIGRHDIERERAERRPSCGLEHHRHRAMVQAEAAPFDRRMRREQTGRAAERDQLAAKILAGAVRPLPRIAFQRHDRFADKAVDPRFEFDQVGGKRKIDHSSLLKRAQSTAERRPLLRPRLLSRAAPDRQAAHAALPALRRRPWLLANPQSCAKAKTNNGCNAMGRDAAPSLSVRESSNQWPICLKEKSR